MKKITFTKLSITNFKGIKSFESELGQNVTISGDNATGKSTIFDAILWCLFGKNSQNDQKFSIKNTVDTSLNRADHIVELTMMVDGQPVVAKRLYKETWTKRRGSEETEFTGHETLYFWNNVPCSQKEYQVKVSEVCEEQIFKLLTNPLYFNVTLKETERRETLVRMAGVISDEKIISGAPAYVELFAKIQGKKSLDEYKKEVSYEKTALKKNLTEIPTRIDEILKNMPKSENWQDLDNEIKQKEKAIAGVDLEISGTTSGLEEQNKNVQRIQTAVFNAQTQMRIIENRLKGEAENKATKANFDINQARMDLPYVRSNIQRLIDNKGSLEQDIIDLNLKRDSLRTQWIEQNAKTIEFKGDFICPACKRELEPGDAEAKKAELEASFNQGKAELLDSISQRGISYKEQAESKAKQIEEIRTQLVPLSTKMEELISLSEKPLAQPAPIDLSSNADYLTQKAIAEQVIPVVEIPDTSDLKEMKQVLVDGVDELKKLLSGKVIIDQNNARIEELKADEKRYSKELASLEKVEFTIDSFQKKRMELVEQSVNDKFKIVKFKLFRVLINGGEEPCCITTVNNVEFSDLNHAMQINSGIDVINALSEFYGVSAPLVVDNSEALTSFLPTDSQMIKLYVVAGKELEVVNN